MSYNKTDQDLRTTAEVAFKSIQFDTTFAEAMAEGKLAWNSDDGTLQVGMPGGNVSLQIGQEQLIRVRNTTGVQIDNGSLCYVNGASGNKPLVTLAKADAESTSSKTIGMLTEDVAHNSNGYLTTFGLVRDIDTSSYSEGDALWLSKDTAGAHTVTRPDAPNHGVFVGYVLRSHATTGIILVKIQNGWELNELHDVNYPTTPADGEVLVWNNSNSRWENKSPVVIGAGAIENVVTVSATGADYTSIKDAIDYVTTQTPSSSNRWQVQVGPGTYTEAPMVIVPYVEIVPMGGKFTTKIEPSNVNSPLFTTSGAGPIGIEGLAIDGVTNSSAFKNATASAALRVLDCTILDCKYGFELSAGALFCERIGTTSASSMTNMLYATGGAFSFENGTVNSTATFTTFIYMNNATGTVYNLVLDGQNITTGIHALGTSSLKLFGFTMDNGTIGIKLEDTVHMDGGSIALEGSATTHLEIVDSTVLCHISSSQMDSDKFSFPVNYSGELISFIDTKDGDEGFKIFGELGVGRPEEGKESVFGEGDSYTRDMMVHTFDGTSTYADVSEDARSGSGSTFTFAGTGAGNILYVSTDLQNADYLQFYGLKTNITTAMVIGAGELVAEYWNGSAWTEMHMMTRQSGGQYLPYAENILIRTGSEQLRFGPSMLDDWTKNDPISEGSNRYWVRFRIVTAVTTAPIFEQFKLHTNRSEINADGFMEYFGKARPRGTLPWTITNAKAWGNSPDNQDLFFLNSTVDSDYDLGVGLSENSFSASVMDRVGISMPMPLDMDTSMPVEVEIYWMTDNSGSGDILLKQASGLLTVGDGIGINVGDAPTSIRGESGSSQLIAVGSNEEDILKYNKLTFDFTKGIAQYSDGTADIMTISIIRDGSDGTDDFGGAMRVLSLRANYFKWSNGGHI